MPQEEGAKGGSGGGPTLSNLSTYLLLQKAEEQYSWNYEKEGLSVDEAGTIARLFSRYDTNSDDRCADAPLCLPPCSCGSQFASSSAASSKRGCQERPSMCAAWLRPSNTFVWTV